MSDQDFIEWEEEYARDYPRRHPSSLARQALDAINEHPDDYGQNVRAMNRYIGEAYGGPLPDADPDGIFDHDDDGYYVEPGNQIHQYMNDWHGTQSEAQQQMNKFYDDYFAAKPRRWFHRWFGKD